MFEIRLFVPNDKWDVFKSRLSSTWFVDDEPRFRRIAWDKKMTTVLFTSDAWEDLRTAFDVSFECRF